jgi:mannosyl-glycoprotein endo-beta-N-acetylglucosaminidase
MVATAYGILAWGREGMVGDGEEGLLGWTDIDVQTSIGDLVWPMPKLKNLLADSDLEEETKLGTSITPSLCFTDAWHGGSCLELLCELKQFTSSAAAEEQDEEFQSIFVPIQSVSITPEKAYLAAVVYKVANPGSGSDVEVGPAVEPLHGVGCSVKEAGKVISKDVVSTFVPNGWTQAFFSFTADVNAAEEREIPEVVAVSLGVSLNVVIPPSTSAQSPVKILLGQMSVIPDFSSSPNPTVRAETRLLWASWDSVAPPRYSSSSTGSHVIKGTLLWASALSLPPLYPNTQISSIEDPNPAWDTSASILTPVQVGKNDLIRANVYALAYIPLGEGGPGVGETPREDKAIWIAAKEYVRSEDVGRCEVEVNVEGLLRAQGNGGKAVSRVRFYIQPVDLVGGIGEVSDASRIKGNPSEWAGTIWVDVDLKAK